MGTGIATLLVGGEEGRGVGGRLTAIQTDSSTGTVIEASDTEAGGTGGTTQRRLCSRRRQHRHDQWEFTVESGVASNGENPTLTLETGTRYVVENRGCSAHPFVLLNGNDTSLLTQMTAERSQTTPT